jgi:hypothetical protein
MSDGDNSYEMLESMRIYIERFGRPYNYLKSVEDLNEERETHLIEEEKQTEKAKEDEEFNKQNEDLEQREALE